MKTYDQMHSGLHWARGRASEHSCLCGSPARHWAYLHNAGPRERVSPGGSPYSENFDDYAPMCASCHKTLDANKKKEGLPGFAKYRATLDRLLELLSHPITINQVAVILNEEGHQTVTGLPWDLRRIHKAKHSLKTRGHPVPTRRRGRRGEFV